MTTFTIVGSGFAQGTIAVYISDVLVEGTTVVDDATITGTLPLLSTGFKDVTVTKTFAGISQTDVLVNAIEYTNSQPDDIGDKPINLTYKDLLQKTSEVTDGSNIMTLTGTALPLNVGENSICANKFGAKSIGINVSNNGRCEAAEGYTLDIGGDVKLDKSTFFQNPDNWFSRDPVHTSNPNEPPRSKYQLARTYSIPYEYAATFVSNVGFVNGEPGLGSNNGIFTATQNKYSKNNIAGAIALGVFGTNNHESNTEGEYLPGNPASLWACYIEAKRENTGGAGYTSSVESQISNFGNEVRATSSGLVTRNNGFPDRRVTYNLNLGVGAGDQYGVVGPNNSVTGCISVASNVDGRADQVASNRHSSVQYTFNQWSVAAEAICEVEISDNIATITNLNPTYRFSEIPSETSDPSKDVLIGYPTPYKNEYITGEKVAKNTTILSYTPISGGYRCVVSPGGQNVPKTVGTLSHSSRYLSGIIFDAYALDPEYNEAISLYSQHKINWYRDYPNEDIPGASISATNPVGKESCHLELYGTDVNKKTIGIYLGNEINAVTPFNKTITLGSNNTPWAQGFGVRGWKSKSDERAKQDITDIDDVVLNAWEKVNFQRYKLKESPDKWQIGVIAQHIIAAFESEGLNALDYEIVHYTEDTYSVCYEQALALECACLRRKLNDLGF